MQDTYTDDFDDALPDEEAVDTGSQDFADMRELADMDLSAAEHALALPSDAEAEYALANHASTIRDRWRSDVFMKYDEWQALQNVEALHAEAAQLHAQALARREQAHEQGYVQGRQEGYADALNEVFARLASESEDYTLLQPRLQNVLENALQHLLGTEADLLPVSGRVTHALQKAKYPLHARLFVHPDRLGEVKQWRVDAETRWGDEHPARKALRYLEVFPDDSLPPLDLRLDFDSGVIDSQLQVQVDALSEWLERALAEVVSTPRE